jgi:hypothetical protein
LLAIAALISITSVNGQQISTFEFDLEGKMVIGRILAPTCLATQVLVNGVCLNNVGPGVACTSSLQCQFQSTCINGICTCPVGQQNLGGTCAIPVSAVPIGSLTTVATGTGGKF